METGKITKEKILNWSDEIEKLCVDCGILIPEDSNHFLYKKILTEYFSSPGANITQICKKYKVPWQLAAAIFKEYYDYYYSLSSLLPSYKTLDQERKKILKDNVDFIFKKNSLVINELQEPNAFPSKARDTLFEMTMAAQLYNLGRKNLTFRPRPDVLLEFSNHNIGIECKRIKYYGNDNLVENFNSALGQISTSPGLYDVGLVALDVSLLINGAQGLLANHNSDSVINFVKESFDTLFIDIFSKSEKRIIKAATKRTLAGIVFYSSGNYFMDEGETGIYALNYPRLLEEYNPEHGKIIRDLVPESEKKYF